MPNLKLSICVPTYKRHQNLLRCLESIAAQKRYRSLVHEVLIFDNAPDSPAKPTIQNFLKQHTSKFKYKLHRKNLGFELNLLKLLEKASGNYVLILTDDDTLIEDALLSLERIVKKHTETNLIIGARRIIKDGQYLRTDFTFDKSQVIRPNQLAKVAWLYWDSFILTGLCFKKDAINFEGYRESMGTVCPQMYVGGYAALQGNSYYSFEALTSHTVGNKVYWLNKPDYLIGGRIKMLRALRDYLIKNKRSYQKFYDTAHRALYIELAYVIYVNVLEPQKILGLFKSLWEQKLLTVNDVITIAAGAVRLIKLKFTKTQLSSF